MHQNEKLLDAFTHAWLVHDIDAVVSFFAADAVFFASSAYGTRQRASGREDIRALVREMFETDVGAILEPIDKIIFDEGAFCRWRYIMPDGEISLGCDYFAMMNGSVTLKDAYRKEGSFQNSAVKIPTAYRNNAGGNNATT